MKLNSQEKQLVTELKTQEQLCVQKYNLYASLAKGDALKDLFNMISSQEQEHIDMLDSLLNGEVPKISNRKPKSKGFEPKTSSVTNQKDKDFDKFLCTDIICTEKYVATAYNDDLFYFVTPEVRDVLNAIMTDEQNHAEMIWKYKVTNKMVA